MVTVDIESDVRERYNRKVLFCIRIKSATLLIGLWDFFVHSLALFALILMFGRNISSPTNSDVVEPSTNLLSEHKEFLSNSVLLDRILKNRRTTTTPMSMTMSAQDFYTNLDFMMLEWKRSLNKQDQCVVFVIVFISTVMICLHLWGIATKKPSYMIPYFLIKVFNVVMAILSVLGFYAYLPNVTSWLYMHPNFPLRHFLLGLDNQTLQLLFFAFLLLLILVKMYMTAIIWYCYNYLNALNMARSIGLITIDGFSSSTNPMGPMYSPPKYEEAIRSQTQRSDDDIPPPYTPLLSSSTS